MAAGRLLVSAVLIFDNSIGCGDSQSPRRRGHSCYAPLGASLSFAIIDEICDRNAV